MDPFRQFFSFNTIKRLARTGPKEEPVATASAWSNNIHQRKNGYPMLRIETIYLVQSSGQLKTKRKFFFSYDVCSFFPAIPPNETINLAVNPIFQIKPITRIACH